MGKLALRVIAWCAVAVSFAIVASAVVVLWPRGASRVSAEEIASLPAAADAKVVYLTFDAGNAPSNTVAPLLELLGREKVQATFFLTGKWTMSHPLAARDISRGGYLLASHSYSHPYMTKIPGWKRFLEMRYTELAVGAVCGRPVSHLWRPPNGDTSPDIDAEMALLGYRTVMWSKDSRDWPLDGSVSKKTILDRVTPVADGDIAVFHLRNTVTVDALRELIPRLKREGFEFRTLRAVAPLSSAATPPARPDAGSYDT